MINFSQLLWRPGRTKDPVFRTAVGPVEDESRSALDRTPVERAAINAASRIALLTDPLSASADRFRFLRMRLRELRELANLRSLAITSPTPEDGKSTVAICLATVLAEGGKQSVVLIDADLHRPSLTSTVGLSHRPGLAECLANGLEPLAHIRKVEPFGWYLLSAGEARTNPTELLNSDGIERVMRALAAHFDWILVDTPPVLPLSDALLISRQVDATLLVARAGRTRREAIEETVRIIGTKHLVGIVLNGAESLTRLYSQYGGRYGKK